MAGRRSITNLPTRTSNSANERNTIYQLVAAAGLITRTHDLKVDVIKQFVQHGADPAGNQDGAFAGRLPGGHAEEEVPENWIQAEIVGKYLERICAGQNPSDGRRNCSRR